MSHFTNRGINSWLYFDVVPIRPGIVRYDGCFIDTTGGAMDMGTGIFSVAESGIYQLTFTAKYVASNRGRFGAWSDMYVNQKVSSAKSQFLYASSVCFVVRILETYLKSYF